VAAGIGFVLIIVSLVISSELKERRQNEDMYKRGSHLKAKW
jgi:hypothetical protein